jgi:hypothetical protein
MVSRSVSRLATFGSNVWLIVADTLSCFQSVRYTKATASDLGAHGAPWTEYA